MAKDKKQRVQVAIHDDLVLRVLCCEASSQPIFESLAAYAKAIADATVRVAEKLQQQDWNYLADCLNGCFHVYEMSGLSARSILFAEAEDAHRLSRAGNKWYHDDPESDPDSRVRHLVVTLQSLTEIEAQAVLLAVRHFWTCPEIDHTQEEWWTIRHRLGE